ncbi:MAG: hypothetical protein MJB14_20255 [Spirochaetes bacterium]|nr:hypothetical protein [Spirochaetota bacterium]
MIFKINETNRQVELLKDSELSWTPSINSFLAYFMEATNHLFMDVEENAKVVSRSGNPGQFTAKDELPGRQEELLSFLSGHKQSATITDQQQKKMITPDKMPATRSVVKNFDWRNKDGKNYVTSVKLQGFASSCVAFGTIAAMEAIGHINNETPVVSQQPELNLSEQHLFFYNEQAQVGKIDCTSGWNIFDAAEFAEKTGVLSIDNFCDYNPYNQSLRPPVKNLPDNWQEMTYKITDYHILINTLGKTPETIVKMRENMKDAIVSSGPLIGQVHLAPDFLFYQAGIYTNVLPLPAESQNTGHCVTIIGFDDDKQAWLCKNSWGIHWGEQGYVWIKYGEIGIEDMAIVIKGIE